MVEWMIKKVICSKINGLLREYKSNVESVRETLRTWIARTRKILSLLESASERISDGDLTPEEARETADEIQAVIREW